MRTLAVTAALVTALGGTGCIVSANAPMVGDADIAWRFRDYDLALAGDWTQGNTGCGVASVSFVRVTLRDGAGRVVDDRNWGCVDATGYPRAYVAALPVGRYAYTLEAWRVDAPVFYGQGVVDVFDGQTTTEDATLDVEAVVPLTVYFTQNGARTCAPAGQFSTPSIRVDIFYPATSSTLLEPSTTFACAGSNFGYTARNDQPVGNTYGYDVYALDAGGLSVNERCLVSVRHTGFPVTINLLPGACGP
jgi:hypothetical protein